MFVIAPDSSLPASFDQLEILNRFNDQFRVHLVCEYPHSRHVLSLHEHEGYQVSNIHDFLDLYIENIATAVRFLSYDSVTNTSNPSLSLHRYYSELLSWIAKGNGDLIGKIISVNRSFESNLVQLFKDLNNETSIGTLISALNANKNSFKGIDKGMKCVSTRNDGVKYLCNEHYQEYYECKLIFISCSF